MAPVTTKPMTVDEFYRWASRPQNQDKLVELDEGRIVEVPPAGEYHGVLCAYIVHLLWRFAIRRGKGYVCSNDTGLLIQRKPGTVRGPDIMLFDESRFLKKLSRRFAERIPKLVVEVLSPSDQMTKMSRRISQFLKRGVPLVWLVDPEERAVTVYRPDREHVVFREEDSLTGEEVLPGLRYRVAELFAFPGQ